MPLVFGPYRLDPDVPLLQRGDTTVPLPPRALLALTMLIQQRHTAVTKRQLMDALWPDAFVEEGSLIQLISVLRKALAPGFPDESPIETLPKLGYRFVAAVSEVSDAAPCAVAAQTSQELPSADPIPDPFETVSLPVGRDTPVVQEPASFPGFLGMLGTRWRSALRPALLLLLLILLAGSLLLRKSNAVHGSQSASRSAIAILPFQNLTNQSSDAWVGPAVQELLSTDLRLHQGFRVLPTQDVERALKETEAPQTASLSGATLRRLGNDLDCSHAVTGAYLLHDGHLRLDVRLVNLLNGGTEKEESFDEPQAALLPVIAELQRKLAQHLGVHQEQGDISLTQLAPGLSIDAYRLYTQGAALVRDYDGKGAVEVLTRLLAKEPDFALAHLQLSTAWSERGEEREAAKEATRAEQLAGSLPREQQLMIHARAEGASHRFAQAADTYRVLFRFYPDAPEYGRLLVQSLADAGKSEEAMQEAHALIASFRNQQPDPMTYSVIADLYSTRGDWTNALAWAEKGALQSKRQGALILYERLLTTESQANLYLMRLPSAEAQTQEALELAETYGDVSGRLRALNRMGQIATAQGKWQKAEDSLKLALQLEQALDQSQRQVHTLLTLSRLSQQRSALPAATLYASQALQLANTLGRTEVQTEARLQVATVLGMSGSRSEALRQLVQVQASAQSINDAFLLKNAELVSARFKREATSK